MACQDNPGQFPRSARFRGCAVGASSRSCLIRHCASGRTRREAWSLNRLFRVSRP